MSFQVRNNKPVAQKTEFPSLPPAVTRAATLTLKVTLAALAVWYAPQTACFGFLTAALVPAAINTVNSTWKKLSEPTQAVVIGATTGLAAAFPEARSAILIAAAFKVGSLGPSTLNLHTPTATPARTVRLATTPYKNIHASTTVRQPPKSQSTWLD